MGLRSRQWLPLAMAWIAVAGVADGQSPMEARSGRPGGNFEPGFQSLIPDPDPDPRPCASKPVRPANTYADPDVQGPGERCLPLVDVRRRRGRTGRTRRLTSPIAGSASSTSPDRETTQSPISASVHTLPAPVTPAEMYLDLMKRVLTRTISARPIERHTLTARFPPKRMMIRLVDQLLAPFDLEMVKLVHCTSNDYLESGHAASNRAEDAETMLGIRQLDNMQACISSVLEDRIPGDFFEAGVWRGGMTIFMRAALWAWGDRDRRVWVADSFSGLPSPNSSQDSFGWHEGDMAVSLQEVQGNFARYVLLDDQVCFLKGYFCDTLPCAPIERLAILRADADLYESTLDVLQSLYGKLSPGGYAIFDDYQNLVDCRRAIDEFRLMCDITEPIETIDQHAVFWRKHGLDETPQRSNIHRLATDRQSSISFRSGDIAA